MSWKGNFPTENVYFTTKNGILYNGRGNGSFKTSVNQHPQRTLPYPPVPTKV